MARRGRTEFAVIGLGRFGSSVALTLTRQGYFVLGIDRDPALVQQLSDELTHVVALDATDEDALHDVDIASFETVIVAIGERFEDALLVTTVLKDMGIKTVVTKAISERRREILLKVGADRVVLPEVEAGQRLALELTTAGMFGSLVVGPHHTIIEAPLPANMAGQTVHEADIRRRYQVTALAVVRGEEVIVSPPADLTMKDGDYLVVLGDNDDLRRFTGNA